MLSVKFPVRPDVQAHLVINCVIGCVVFIIVVARLVARKFMGAGVGLDDLLIACALPLCFTLLGIQGAFSRLGSGYPMAEVMVNVPTILPLTFAFQLVYILALSLVKSSILCFYRRVFVSARLRLATNVMFGVVAVWGLAHSMAVIFVCTPVSFQWDLSIDGKCGDQIKLFQSLITTNILTDAMIMIIPVYTVWHLQMRRTEKVAVTACFLIGIIVIIAAIARMIYLSTVDMRGDLTHTMPVTVFLSAFEPNLAVLCASIPMLRPCYTRFKNRADSKLTGERSDGYDSGMKGSANSKSLRRNSRSNALELDTIHMLEHNIEYKSKVEVETHSENGHSLDGNGSERNSTHAHRTNDSRSTIGTAWAVSRS